MSKYDWSKREIPKHVKSFSLTRVTSESTTYHFRPDRGSGWALATVNDATLELAIQSDWGSWTYRWPAGGMATGSDGRRCTLTEFLSDRNEWHCDYVADKLTSYEDRHQFDSYASVKAMRKYLLEQRLEQGRKHIAYYEDEEPEDRVDVGTDDPKRWGPMDFYKVRCKYTHKDEDWPLTKQVARTLYDELGELEGSDDHDSFLSKFFEIEGHTIIADEPWHSDMLRFEPSPHYYQLLHGILPALVRACGRTMIERQTNTPVLARPAPEMRGDEL